MEWGIAAYAAVSGILEYLLGFHFFVKSSGKQGKTAWYVLFTVLGYVVEFLPLHMLLKLAVLITLLFFFGISVLRISCGESVLYAVLSFEVMQLCWGISDSVTEILCFFLYASNPAFYSYVFMIGGGLFAMGLACLCYFMIYRYFRCENMPQNRQIRIILPPILLAFAVSSYIQSVFYRELSITGTLDWRYVQILAVQVLAAAGVFSSLYAYQRLADGFRLEAELSALEQQNQFQKQYVEEARMRYEKTKSFRHDMKNHLLVMKEMIARGEVEKAGEYIEEMDTAARNMAFSFQTNNPVLDILLETKLSLAAHKGISVDSTLKIPFPCLVNDMDFCIIMANALDNAIHACERLDMDGERHIYVSSKMQGDFLLLEIENSFDGNSSYRKDTGLSNIERTAEKYNGSISITIQEKVFCLNVLLIIPHHPEDISQQSGAAGADI
ncbi:GHKL domain-containing protein [Lachnospiraceae bacterium 46-15]